MSSDEVKKFVDIRGRGTVALMDNLLLDLVYDVSEIKRFLGLNSGDLDRDADDLLTLCTKMNKPGIPEQQDLEDLCNLLARLSISDFLALREFWAFPYSPRAIAQMLHEKAHGKYSKNPPIAYQSALESLRKLDISVLNNKLPLSS